jgi:drug/metabolite transporter (DMT)-like permease
MGVRIATKDKGAIMVKVLALLVLAMFAFAANSVLTRVGVAGYGMDPMDFAALRTGAGAVMLGALVWGRSTAAPVLLSRRRAAGAVALTLYMVAFSWAYLTLDAGLGALILFGVLQVAIFGWTIATGGRIAGLAWAGAVIALVGLVLLLWPSTAFVLPVQGVIAMGVAGTAWAGYTLLGRGEPDALGATAGNFVLATPLVLLALPFSAQGTFSALGALAAVVAGALTSGLGYALFYRIMPHLPATLAGIAQLSVPVLAVAAGWLLLDEAITARMIWAGALVLGGIGLSLMANRPMR